MKVERIDVDAVLAQAKEAVEQEPLSASLKSVIQLLIFLVSIMVKRLSKNSGNSSKPPASDPNRKRGSRNPNSNRKPGGQNGHPGHTLNPVENPDHIESLTIDQRQLPPGDYKEVGYESRQIIDIKMSRVVTEYRAQILENERGQRFVAEFPVNVTRPVQYGSHLKAIVVYMSQYQLIPYDRIQDYFEHQFGLPISKGSFFNFNQEAFNALEPFELRVKNQLMTEPVVHFDETGIQVDTKRLWLHSTCNGAWSYFYPHDKRGQAAMDEINILPQFHGVACHDHWKPYFHYDCLHSLCNAHHLRELRAVTEQNPSMTWSIAMKDFLLKVHEAKRTAMSEQDRESFSAETLEQYQQNYRAILKQGEVECPLNQRQPGQKGKLKQTKARNLLQRFMDYEAETLRFIYDFKVPFTNNQGENDLRMTKVQQKISGCFRSIEGARMFCRIRSYLLTCQKHQINATEALNTLFAGELPKSIFDST